MSNPYFDKEKVMETMQVNPIVALVDRSTEMTKKLRDDKRAHPDYVADMTSELMGRVDYNLNEIYEFNVPSNLITSLPRFSLLDTTFLNETHRVPVEHKGCVASADIPLYGVVSCGVLECWIWVNYTQEHDGSKIRSICGWGLETIGNGTQFKFPHDCGPSPKGWGKSFLTKVHNMALSFQENKTYTFYLNVPKIWDEVRSQMYVAGKIGFSNLSIVWGPTTLALERCSDWVDFLLIGKMHNQWWILNQWGPH